MPTPQPRFRPLDPLPEELLSPGQLRDELIRLRESLCQDLQAIAGVILNTGTLTRVPGAIQALTGLSIDRLEEMETEACQPAPAQSVPALLGGIRDVEWLLRVHLAALDAVTMADVRLRPVDAAGSFAAFLRLHDVIILELRKGLAALESGRDAREAARCLGEFWQDVLVPHASAEEKSLFPLARALPDAMLTRSADLVEREHRPIEARVDRYLEVLRIADRGRISLSELEPLARDLRGIVELHFAKEEQSVVRPLQVKVTEEAFAPVVVAQDQTIGAWARGCGWERSS